MKSRSGSSKSGTIILRDVGPGTNLVGIPINQDAATYMQSKRITPNSIIRTSQGEMSVERVNGMVISGYPHGETPSSTNRMAIDLRNENAELLYLARVEAQQPLL